MPIYLLIVNALGFVLMLADKYKAKNNLWRIPETTLMGTHLHFLQRSRYGHSLHPKLLSLG